MSFERFSFLYSHIPKKFLLKDFVEAKMQLFSIINKIKEIYVNGGNIINYISSFEADKNNSQEAILISYDFQAGTYVDKYRKDPGRSLRWAEEIAQIISRFTKPSSIMEAGVGEATTFKGVIEKLGVDANSSYGFDLSWSRVKVAKDFLNYDGIFRNRLFVGDLFTIPLKDNSIDVVYTSHSVEPNGGKEIQALEELYRVTGKYLVLVEPDFTLADIEGQNRMESHGYIKDLYGTAKRLGYDVVLYEPFGVIGNPLNPASVIVIEKCRTAQCEPGFICPITKTQLQDAGEIYFSPDAYLMYPVIQGIPCLLGNNAILGTKYKMM